MLLLSALLNVLLYSLVSAINRPPHIYVQPVDKDIYYKPRESVQITCIADGIPKPIYKWQRNGINYNPSGQDSRVVQLPNQGTIVFNSPEDKDEGIFQCFADNGYGISASIKINLREAKLSTFAYDSRQNHVAYAGSSLTLPCTPPQSFPPADVYWVIKEPGGRWQAINFDKRVSMDIEGKLRFTNVRATDQQGGKAYACKAVNYFMRVNVFGPEHTVTVQGTTEQKRPAYELWTSPSDQFFLKGKLLRLKCIFAGNPTPDVYWEKLNGQLPDRAILKSFGQELAITNLELSDAGQYECMGTNTETTQRATKAFTVRIESSPFWTREPENVEVGPGERATFVCEADGIPKPTYIWYINGVVYDSVNDTRVHNNPRVLKTDNELTITNLTLDDHFNIQCNATNKHDYVFSDVYLNVMAEKPTIIVPPPPFAKVAEGQSVQISCQVTGKPDPIVTWYRDTSLITGGRFKIMPNGDLNIKNVVMADAGMYRCQASNIYQRDVTSSGCRVQIRRKTRIEQLPMDLEVIAGYDAKFTCSGSTDFDEASNMIVYWEKDGKRVSTTEQRMSQNFQDNSLTISGTIVRDSGVYTCVITNGLDEDRAYAILTVKDRPDPPSGVEVQRCHSNSATLSWRKGISNNAPVHYFIIQYNTTFNPDQWVSALSVDATLNTASIQLKPWSNYTFRVLATNKIGASAPSFHSVKGCTIKSAQPDKNPANVRSIGNRRNYLVIEWVPMNQLEHNGPNFKYQLSVKERGTTDSQTFFIDNWNNNSIAIPVQNRVYTPFLVKMQAKNDNGDSKADPEERVLYSYEDIPAVQPFDVQVTNISSTSANLQFMWDTDWNTEAGMIQRIKGQFRGFKIQYWRVGEKLSTFSEENLYIEDLLTANPMLPFGRKKRATTNAKYLLRNLSPFSQMQIQVCVMNNFYVSAPSDVVSFSTFEGVPGPVQNFFAPVRSSNSFTLVWERPLPEDVNGILTGYDIGYQTVHGLTLGAFHDRDEQIDDPFSTLAILSGLLPNTKYRVHIYARTQYGRGEGTFIEVSTTDKADLGAPQFNIGEVTESMINVTWSPGSNFGAHLVHYVEFRKEGAADWQQTADEVIQHYKEVHNLEKGTYYEIRVVAFDGMHRATSETKVVGTVGFAAARSIASNYGWFVGMLLAGLACIGIVVFIYLIYRGRRNVEEAQRPKSYAGGMPRDTDFDRDSRGQYNDYYKEDRKRYRNERYEDYEKEKDRHGDKEKEAHVEPIGYSNHDYSPKNGGFDEYDKDHDDRDDYDDDYDRHYDDYDRDYDREYDDEDYERERYDDYPEDDDEDVRHRKKPVAYDDPPSYPEVTRKRISEDMSKEYKGEPSKFDEDGYPLEPSSPSSSHASTFV